LVPPLLEPYYREKRAYQIEFEGYTSIRLAPLTIQHAPTVLDQALYYLNSDYLAPLKTGAQVFHLADPADLLEPPWEKAERVPRKRLRTRPLLPQRPPLLLFNEASVALGEGRFLGFYRVLEYFFKAGFEREVARLRMDQAISVTELVKVARERSEEEQLARLLHVSTTPAAKRRFASWARSKRLIAKESFELLPQALYAYRCAIVHAKAQEVHRTRLPDPLQHSDGLSAWQDITRELAIAAMKRFNKSP